MTNMAASDLTLDQDFRPGLFFARADLHQIASLEVGRNS